MRAHRDRFRLTLMCKVLKASRSGFYAWLSIPDRHNRRRQQTAVDRRVRNAFFEHKQRYGSPRLTKALAANGHVYDRKTIAASMRRQGLRAKAARRFKATTFSNHNLPVSPNLLEQNFKAEGPDQKYVGDITYLRTGEGWLYLSVVIDLYSRRVVGWSMSDRMKSSLVCNALRMALDQRRPAGTIVHSDRGSQYCSKDYQSLLTSHKLKSSMSAKGNCYDNACAESFFHSLKVEAIHGNTFPNRRQMRRAVFEYIEIDYNRNRLHSANGYLSPADFEAQNNAKPNVH